MAGACKKVNRLVKKAVFQGRKWRMEAGGRVPAPRCQRSADEGCRRDSGFASAIRGVRQLLTSIRRLLTSIRQLLTSIRQLLTSIRQLLTSIR